LRAAPRVWSAGAGQREGRRRSSREREGGGVAQGRVGGVGLGGSRRREKGRGKEKKEEKIKRRKRKRKGEKRKRKQENKRRKIEKKFRKLGEISRKILRRVFAGFSGFLRYRRQFRDDGDGKADRPAGPRRCGIPVVVADLGAGAARVGDGPGAGGAGGIRGTPAEGKELTGVLKRG
jgi:hypothetical protein